MYINKNHLISNEGVPPFLLVYKVHANFYIQNITNIILYFYKIQKVIYFGNEK